jgi:hypothetical protein
MTEPLSQSASSPQARGDSYIVSLYGLDGLREHWTPGNRKTGKPATAKRTFASEAEAQTFIDERPHLQRPTRRGPMGVYRCGICGCVHIGRKS